MVSAPVRRAVALAPLALPILLLLPELGYVPIYDGRDYANCIVAMGRAPSLDRLTCAGHPTHAYILFTGFVQALAPTRAWPLLVSHLALCTIALEAFRRVLAHLLPGDDAWIERTLALAALAVNPVLLACTLQPNADLPVAAASLVVVAALLGGRVAVATLAGLALVFSKETGTLCLAAILATFAVTHVTRGPGSLAERARGALSLAPLCLPFVALVARLAYLRFVLARAALVVPPTAPRSSSIAAEVLSFRPLDRVFLSFVSGFTVLQFQWLLTVPIVVFACRALARWLFAIDDPRDPARAKPRFAVALFFGFAIAATRYPTFSSPRYWLWVLPVMLAAAAVALADLVPTTARRAWLGAYAAASALSLHASVDPVSRWLYGTFDYGEHAMFVTSAITDFRPEVEDTGGRDGLVYNLQFANIHRLQDAILTQTRSPGLVHIVDHRSEFHLIDKLDDEGRRTLDPAGHEPRTVLVQRAKNGGIELMLDRPGKLDLREAVYVVYPRDVDYQAPLLKGLLAMAKKVGKARASVDGYAADVFFLRFTDDAAPASAPPN